MNPVPLRTMSKGIALLNLIEGHTAVSAPPALLSIIYIMALFANNVILYGHAVGFYICVPRRGLICCASCLRLTFLFKSCYPDLYWLITIMCSAVLCAGATIYAAKSLYMQSMNVTISTVHNDGIFPLFLIIILLSANMLWDVAKLMTVHAVVPPSNVNKNAKSKHHTKSAHVFGGGNIRSCEMSSGEAFVKKRTRSRIWAI